MGVPKHSQYVPDVHAVERFIERIDPHAVVDHVPSRIRKLLPQARFAERSNGGRELWINELEGVTIVLNPSTKRVITVYRTDDERVSPLSTALRDSSPEVRDMISKASATQRSVTLRETSEKLAPLYSKMTYHLEIMGRTLKTSVMDEHLVSIRAIQSEIRSLEEGRDTLINELSMLI